MYLTNEVLTAGEDCEYRGSTITLGQEGDPSCRITRMLCEQHIHSAKEQWEGTAHPQPEESQHIPRVRAFQDGGYTERTGPAEQERLHVQVRSQGCILNSPHTSFPLEISLFQLAGQGIRVWSSSFRPATAPKLFTKLLKPVLDSLRSAGVRLIGYLDDFLIMGKTKRETEKAFLRIKSLLESLDFIVNGEKSLQIATHRIEFLGFIIDSAQMTIRLPAKKIKDITSECRRLLQDKVTTARKLAQLIGMLGRHKSGSPPCPSSLPVPSGTEGRRSSLPPLPRICSDS